MRSIRVLVVMGLLLGVACAEQAPGTTDPTSGGNAPDFTVETFADGTFALSEHRGRVVVLNFFESW